MINLEKSVKFLLFCTNVLFWKDVEKCWPKQTLFHLSTSALTPMLKHHKNLLKIFKEQTPLKKKNIKINQVFLEDYSSLNHKKKSVSTWVWQHNLCLIYNANNVTSIHNFLGQLIIGT